MKHLKPYRIFENVSNTDLKLDVEDMLLELEDLRYQVNVDMRPQGVDMFCVEISNDNLFHWSEFIRQTSELDKLRNQSFKETFPELFQILKLENEDAFKPPKPKKSLI